MRRLAAVFLLVLSVSLANAASITNAPVPKSPYLPLIYRFADTLIEHGRDTNGAFIDVLDRKTFEPRPSTNFYDQQNLLRLLYTLSELSGKAKYRGAADAALRGFLKGDPSKYSRTWMLWNRCFEIAPEASAKFALRLAQNPTDPHSGFCLRTWSAAYARTTNEMFLGAIEALASRLGPGSGLSLAIDCDGSACLLPQPVGSRLRALASREDDAFCKAGRIENPLWDKKSAAQIGMICVSRYENTARIEYRDLIRRTAEAYLNSSQPEGQDLLPSTLGQAISLQLAAWRSTARPEHLAKAREFADFEMERFFDGSPLPRGRLGIEDYEAHTGTDTLALAMTELHLHILYITAVRCPPNTIDR